jgi:predicted Fe-Mo cluster-binding NifX family protein
MRFARAVSSRKNWALLACALLLVVPWLVVYATRAPGPSARLIAVPVDARDLSAPVAPDFASARYLALVDLSTGRTDFVSGASTPGATLGLKPAYDLLSHGVGAVVVQGIGLEPRNALYSRGVRVFNAPPGSAYAAVQLFAGGSLAEFSAPRDPTGGPGQPFAYPMPGTMPGRGIPAGQTPGVPNFPIPAVQQAPLPYPTYPAPAAPAQPAGVDDGSVGLQGTTAPTGGVSVLGVRRGSRAHRAGLRLGDVIVKVGQTEAKDVDQLYRTLPSVPQSDPVPLLVARNGQFLQLWLPP